MSKELNVYAIVSFNFKGVSSNVIVDNSAKVRAFDTESGFLYVETSKPVNLEMVEEVSVAFISGKSRLFYNGHIEAFRKTEDNTIIYKIAVPTEVTIKTSEDKISTIKNQMIQKFKGSISGRTANKEEEVETYEA